MHTFRDPGYTGQFPNEGVFGKVECCMDKRHRYKTAVLTGTNIYVGLISFDHDKGFLVDVLGEVKWMQEDELDRFVL